MQEPSVLSLSHLLFYSQYYFLEGCGDWVIPGGAQRATIPGSVPRTNTCQCSGDHLWWLEFELELTVYVASTPKPYNISLAPFFHFLYSFIIYENSQIIYKFHVF